MSKAVMIVNIEDRGDTEELHKALAAVLATVDVDVQIRTSLIEDDEGIFRSEIDTMEPTG